MNKPKPRIVLVEDNETDVLLVRRALAHYGIDCDMERWADGELAEAAILGWQSKPSLVLMDLNLPRVDGFELLHLIRSRPELDGVRVAILTSSRSAADMRKARELGADAYIIKPPSLESFLSEVGTMIRELLRGRPRNHNGDAHAA
jgi:DNA-binding response OmpR family regulator